MAGEDLVVGLDIGTTKVCVVVGEYNENGQLEIIGVGTTPSRGLRRGVVINIETTVRSIATAVEAAEMMSGREVPAVYTGIAGGLFARSARSTIARAAAESLPAETVSAVAANAAQNTSATFRSISLS